MSSWILHFRGGQVGTMIVGVMLTVVCSLPAQSDLRARLGGSGSAVMRVLGIDGEGRIRLVPESGGAGEALLPVREARDLQFVLPEDYRSAQQRVFAGRAGEAVFMLSRFVPSLVPYAGIENSNAQAAVRLYLRLLIGEQQWPDALAVAGGLSIDDALPHFVPEVVGLAHALQEEGRMSDVVWLMERLPVTAGDAEQLRLISRLADEMRRGRHWAEAQSLYEKLRANTGEETERRHLDLLLAYTDWHMGSSLRTAALLSDSPEEMGRADESDILANLLRGRWQLEQDEVAGALDTLGRTLVGIESASEWRVEITALLAQAYRRAGRVETAARIEADLRRLFPDSPWLPPASDRSAGAT